MFAHGFPNLFLLMPGKQTALAFNFPHIIDMQSRHAARIIEQCKQRGIDCFEVGTEDEDAWREEIEANSFARLPTLQECTPGYFNGEGKLATSFFANIFSGGPFVYSEVMDNWFEERFRYA